MARPLHRFGLYSVLVSGQILYRLDDTLKKSEVSEKCFLGKHCCSCHVLKRKPVICVWGQGLASVWFLACVEIKQCVQEKWVIRRPFCLPLGCVSAPWQMSTDISDLHCHIAASDLSNSLSSSAFCFYLLVCSDLLKLSYIKATV